MPSDGKEYVSQFPNTKQEEYSDMREAVEGSNVLYVTRVQYNTIQLKKLGKELILPRPFSQRNDLNT